MGDVKPQRVKVGETVILEYTDRLIRQKQKPFSTGTVSKVGRVYFYVKVPDYWSTVQVYLKNFRVFGDPNFVSAYLSEVALNEELERRKVIREIQQLFREEKWRKLPLLLLTELRGIMRTSCE